MKITNLTTRFLPVFRQRVLLGLLVVLLAVAPTLALAQTVEWIRQVGTSEWDFSYSVSADGLGNVYISGETEGSLGGLNAGYRDAFVSKYNALGTLLWTKQLGTSSWDASFGVSADGLGNVYISGFTEGSLGRTNSRDKDAFLSKYDESGTLQWTQQWGNYFEDDVSRSVSADGLGNVYIAGNTPGNLGSEDAFLSKYDESGTLQWTTTLKSNYNDRAFSVSADGLGNVYISGYTRDSLGGPNAGEYDAFVSKYDDSGILQWIKQLGTSNSDASLGVSADGLGNVYISGFTYGSLGGPNAGSGDAFVSKYDDSGTLLWTEQLGTSGSDTSYGLSVDGLGNVYITGETEGSLETPNAGSYDAFISKFDAGGTLLWTKQFGTSGRDVNFCVSADGLDNVYFSGSTTGSLDGLNAGGYDAFVGKIVPEPSTFVGLLGLCLAGLLAAAKKHGFHITS